VFKFNHNFLDRDSLSRTDPVAIKNRLASTKSKLILFNNRYQVLMQPDGLHLTNAKHLANIPDSKQWIYLGHSEFDPDEPWFCARVNDSEFELSHHQQWHDLRLSLPSITEPTASIVAYAKALLYWHSQHKHCGKCGAKAEVHMSGHERHCPACDHTMYPRTDPAIIIAVTYNEQLLLARQASWPKARYSVLAGFVEPGESFEHAAIREVKEESGLDIHFPKYVASQPWPFPCSIMIGFLAEAKHQNLALLDQELEHAVWVSPENIGSLLSNGELKLPTYGSISHALIEHWANARHLNLSRWIDN